jgi:hypothetical protein
MRLCALALVCVVLGLSGCQSAEPNLLRNGSFEQGVEPWFSLESEHWAGFSRSDRYAVDGRFSAYLALRADPEDHGAKVFGLIQELRPKRFPKRLSGYYRVENWRRGTAKQYLQCVIIAWGDRAVSQYSNVQIRYILAGLTEPPFAINNARFVFLGDREPIQGRWVRFERDLRSDFLQQWGHIPENFEKIRVLCEARYDDKEPGTVVSADVYYDALYLGD